MTFTSGALDEHAGAERWTDSIAGYERSAGGAWDPYLCE
jgi:hypothetical protein